MSLASFLTRLRFLFTRRPPDDLDDELRFHIDQAIQANLAAGMSPEEARRRARIDFGGIEHAREESARQHPRWLLATIAQDTRYALRGFRRNPLFALTVSSASVHTIPSAFWLSRRCSPLSRSPPRSSPHTEPCGSTPSRPCATSSTATAFYMRRPTTASQGLAGALV
jgi:hypothetical protein